MRLFMDNKANWKRGYYNNDFIFMSVNYEGELENLRGIALFSKVSYFFALISNKVLSGVA